VRGVLDELRPWLEKQRGAPLEALEALPGGAGARRYWRARFARGASAVVMHAVPEDPAIVPPGLRQPGVELPFVVVTAFLSRHGLPVPAIEAVEPQRRWLLLEDLGSTHLCDLEGEELIGRLREAAQLLARVHRLPRGDELPFQRGFDASWVGFEVDTFVAHAPLAGDRAALRAALEPLVRAIAALPRTLCLRDYQSQNLMVDPTGRLRILDYQDALLAPPELDLAGFLHDSYIAITPAQRAELLQYYCAARGARVRPEVLAMLVAQRKSKDLGRYRYAVEHKGDARYAPYLERARASVLDALEQLPPEQVGVGRALRAALGG
jgi:aminoglycoside/choline kinase family phosphotransferase